MKSGGKIRCLGRVSCLLCMDFEEGGLGGLERCLYKVDVMVMETDNNMSARMLCCLGFCQLGPL